MSPWFRIKAVLAVIGFGVGLAGMALDARPVVWIAASLLAAAFLLRFIESRAPADRPEADQPSIPGQP
jgi:hypothetical protein